MSREVQLAEEIYKFYENNNLVKGLEAYIEVNANPDKDIHALVNEHILMHLPPKVQNSLHTIDIDALLREIIEIMYKKV